MPDPDLIYWYQYDVIPLVGFVRAPTIEEAAAVALEDACERIRGFLQDSELRLDPVIPTKEVSRDAPHDP